MTKFTLAVGVAFLLAAVGCSGPPGSPVGPTSAISGADIQLGSATGSVSASGLDATELPATDGDHIEAALNLSGIWTGTVKVTPRELTYNTDFNMKHSGKTITGKFVKPVIPGYAMTVVLTESTVSGSKRTYKVVLTITVKGRCNPSKQPGTFIIDTTKKTLTGSTTGINTDCFKETNSFNLRKK